MLFFDILVWANEKTRGKEEEEKGGRYLVAEEKRGEVPEGEKDLVV